MREAISIIPDIVGFWCCVEILAAIEATGFRNKNPELLEGLIKR